MSHTEQILDALQTGLEYARQALSVHDAQYGRHPALESERKIITDEIAEIERAMDALTAPAAEVPEAMGDADQREWAIAVRVAGHGVQGRVPVKGSTLLAVNAQLRSTRLCGGVPEGWPRKATPEMVEAFKEAYKHGSIWTDRLTRAVEAMLEAAPQAPALDAGVVRDAERYRWLRDQDWFSGPLCVLKEPKRVLTRGIGLGADCPSSTRLDAAIDAAMSAQAGKGGA